MKSSMMLSVATLLCAVSIEAQATISDNLNTLTTNARDSMKARFPNLVKLTESTAEAKANNFPGAPWCGLKGGPYEYIPTNKPPVTYTPAASATEISWMTGLSNASDIKAYVDSQLNAISYSHMQQSLESATKYCAVRALNGNNFNGVVIKVGLTNPVYILNQTKLDKQFEKILQISSQDCANYPAYEAALQSEAVQLKKDADEFKSRVCPECYPLQAQDLINRQKELENKQETASNMFQSCMNFTQLFNNTNMPALFGKPNV